jgi:hypothetical protein
MTTRQMIRRLNMVNQNPIEPIESKQGTTEVPIETPGRQPSGRSSPQGTDVGNQAQQRASQLAEQAQTQAKSRLVSQKQRATQGLGSLTNALDQTSQQLRQQGQESMAQYTAKAADRVEHVVGYLDQRDVNQLMGEAQEYARKHPATFLAGAFAVGVAATRFLKSSSQPSQ